MISASALAHYDAQVRQSTRPDEPGVLIEADDTVVRCVSPDSEGASWITWSRLDERTADAVIAAQVEFFRARDQQVEWKLYDYDQPADLGRRLVAAGFVPEEEEALMVAETAEVAQHAPLPAITLRRVADAAGVGLAFDVHERVFGVDESRLRRSVLARLGESPPSVEVVLALAGDEPVSAARVEFPAGRDFAGLWGGGTVPPWRGHGIYRALVACRAALAAARGYRYLQVDALPPSRPILARLGFAELARTTPYVWDPAGAGDTLPA